MIADTPAWSHTCLVRSLNSSEFRFDRVLDQMSDENKSLEEIDYMSAKNDILKSIQYENNELILTFQSKIEEINNKTVIYYICLTVANAM